jgi:hypothetical protein
MQRVHLIPSQNAAVAVGIVPHQAACHHVAVCVPGQGQGSGVGGCTRPARSGRGMEWVTLGPAAAPGWWWWAELPCPATPPWQHACFVTCTTNTAPGWWLLQSSGSWSELQRPPMPGTPPGPGLLHAHNQPSHSRSLTSDGLNLGVGRGWGGGGARREGECRLFVACEHACAGWWWWCRWEQMRVSAAG